MNEDHSLCLRGQLIAMIQNGGFGADGRLPTERELCARFGITRRAVRRALTTLEAEGLVWRRQGKGTFAGQPQDPTGQLAAEVAGETTPIEVMEARLCVEPELAALAARRALPDEVGRMRHLADRRLEAGDETAVELWDGALHRLIAMSARNRPLLTAFSMLDAIRGTQRWIGVRSRARSAASLAQTTRQHHDIIDAIEAGRDDTARSAMRTHLQTRFDALARAESGIEGNQA